MANVTKEFYHDPETIYTEQGASHFLGIAAISLRKMRSEGKGPAWCPVGEKSVRYRRADLVAYLNHRRVIPENEPLLRVFLARAAAEQKAKTANPLQTSALLVQVDQEEV